MKSQAPHTRLGDIAEFVRGVTFKPEDVVSVDSTGSIRCMRTKNVQAELDTSNVLAVAASVVKRPIQYLQQGDTLVSSANSWNLVGKCCWIPDLDWPSTFGGFISVLRADTSVVDQRYLFHWFSSPHIQQTLRTFGRKTTSISNLDLSRCRELAVPVPEMDLQRRIVQILDAADALGAKQRTALSWTAILEGAIFASMFGDPVTNPMGWDEVAGLGDLADVAGGITKGRKLRSPSTLLDVPYLAVSNVQDRRLDLSAVKTISASPDEIKRYRLMSDDLLLTEGGDPDKLGRGTLWRGDLKLCLHQNHIFRVRIANRNILDAQFLSWQIASTRGKRYFLRAAKQTTGIATINKTQLRSFPVLLPPIDLQRKFSSRVAGVASIRERYSRQLSHLNALFASLQDRAFKGEF